MLKKLNRNNLPWPTNWSELFGAARPLIIEIGFGQGQFLLHLAREYPEANIIGLEISNRCLTKAENAIERQALDHVRVVHSTAETALHHLFEPATLTAVYINFPDPWFKNRHGHRRLMQRATVDALVSRLQTGGKLYLATDIIEYAEMSHDLLTATPALDNQLSTPWAAALPGRVVTKYEQRARREGRDCYYFAYQRNQVTAPPIPVIKEFAMPHVVFETPLTLAAIREQFQSSEHQYGPAHISPRAAYSGDHSLLFEVYIKEPTIDQRVAFTIVTHDDLPNQFTLQLNTLGHPRPTAGVHGAAYILSDWLLSLHPANRIIKHKLQPRLEPAESSSLG